MRVAGIAVGTGAGTVIFALGAAAAVAVDRWRTARGFASG